MDPAPPPARVLVLAGPSGAGKSRLASRLHARHGWPVVQLDDFYREGTDTGLPMSPLGLPDWDHVDSWDGEAALDALEQLCREGIAQMPVYDIGRSAVSGTHEVRRDGRTVVVAEGIFAAHVVAGLRERGHAAVVSGAGPTVLVLCDGPEAVEQAAAAARELTADDAEGWRVMVPSVARDGVRVEALHHG